MAQFINRFDVCLISLSPTIGTEIQKTRPCLIVSPNSFNSGSKIVIAPMTSKRKVNAMRVPILFKDIEGDIVLEHIRSVDKLRVLKKIGSIEDQIGILVLEKLRTFFS